MTFVDHDAYLLQCLDAVAKKFGISTVRPEEAAQQPSRRVQKLTIDSVHYFQHELQISLSSLPTTQNLDKAFFPILLQLIDNEWRVLIKNKLYNPYDKSSISFKTFDLSKIRKCWQCFPLASHACTRPIDVFKFILKFFKVDLSIIIILGMLTACAPILLSSFPTYLLDQTLEEQTINIVLLTMLIICYTTLSYINEITINKLTLKLLCYAIPTLWSRIIHLDLKSVRHFTLDELSQILSSYESALFSFLPLLLALFMQTVSMILLLLYMSYCTLWVACVAIFLCVLTIVIKISLLPKQFNFITKKITLQGKLSSLLTNLFLHIDKIRTAHVEAIVHQKWQSVAQTIKYYDAKCCKLEHTTILFEALVPILLFAFFYIGFPNAELQNNLFLTIMLCIAQLSMILKKFSADSAQLLYLVPSLQSVQPIIQANSEQCVGKKWLTQFNGHIRFSNINMTCSRTNRQILNDISFDIQPNSFTAIVGSSGAGKSTIFRLLLGFVQQTSGQIIIDDEPIHQLALPLLRKHFGVVLQTTTILPGTIYSNIAANADISLAEAWELSEQLGLADDIRKMPMQMFTYLSDQPGDSISGGQKQKILLARALAHQPKILLLDEATSAMDNHSQAIVYQFLKQLNLTKLVIAHRTSTIKEAETILIFEKGRLIDKAW